jgi:hypothetical protein
MKLPVSVFINTISWMKRNKVGSYSVELTHAGLRFDQFALLDVSQTVAAVIGKYPKADEVRNETVRRAAKLIQQSLGINQMIVANDHFMLPALQSVGRPHPIPNCVKLSYFQRTEHSVTLNALVELSALEKIVRLVKQEDELSAQSRKAAKYAAAITKYTGIPTKATGTQIHLLHPKHPMAVG